MSSLVPYELISSPLIQQAPWFSKSTNEWRVIIDFERERAEKETGRDWARAEKKEREKKRQEREEK